MVEAVEVIRGSHREPTVQIGPLVGVREGNVVAYEFELPERFEPWPGRTRVERTFVLLDVGVSFANPCWQREHRADGSVVEMDPHGQGSWYVDLVTVSVQGNRYTLRDAFLDVIVPTDGRPYRLLDLDEYADAIASGALRLDVALDGLRRWQWFLDRHLHARRWPRVPWSDFPPAAIRPLADLPSPLTAPFRLEG